MRLKKRIVFDASAFLLIIFLGTLAYKLLENWQWIDALYFTVATVTTIGYGDIVPTTPFGKLFTIIFAFVGVSMVLYFFSMLGKYVFKKAFEDRLEEHGAKIMDHIEKTTKEIMKKKK